MTKVEEFKDFVKENKSLINYVKKGDKTWQDFYELYDLYGRDQNVWKAYLEDTTKDRGGSNFNNFLNTIESIDTDKIQDSITSMQKAIALFGDIITKNNNSNINNYNPRPVYRRFDD